jgi:hypothetical protein
MMWPRVGVDIGGVDEVDSGVEGELEEFVGERLLDAGDRLPHAFASGEGHGAETEFGDEQAGVAESVVLHGYLEAVVDWACSRLDDDCGGAIRGWLIRRGGNSSEG